MFNAAKHSRLLSATRSIDVASSSFSARLAAQRSASHTPGTVAQLGQTLAASRSSRFLSRPGLRAGTGKTFTGAIPLMRAVHQQTRSMHHAHMYFALSPNHDPPRPHRPGICLPPTYLDPDTYKLVSRYNISDSWLWIKPGNKFARIEVYNAAGTEEQHKKEVEELTRHDKTLTWILTDEAAAKKTTFIPIERPNTEEPLAVHTFAFKIGPRDDDAKNGEPDDDAQAGQESAKQVSQQSNTDPRVGKPYWTADMLGSLNDPKVRKARKEAQAKRIKEAKQNLAKPPKRTFNRTVREGVHRRHAESGTNWLIRMAPRSKSTPE